MNSNYSVTIRSTSFEDMTAKQRIKLKNTGTAIKLDEVTPADGSAFVIERVDGYAILDVHNENARDEKDYPILVISSGDKTYSTGSRPLTEDFMNIFEEITGTGEEWGIEVYRVPSNNFKGKTFLKCDIY